MKKSVLIILSLIMATIIFAQNQTINGNLHVSNTSGGSLRIGKVSDIGNKAVPVGGLAARYNLDFSGYRDVAADQIGARIAALRFNRHLDNNALVQKTGLAFYTNPLGMNTGTTDLVERMRITPEGNIGIGTDNPQYKLDVNGTSHSNNIVVGNQGTPNSAGSIERLSIAPYGHTGRWTLSARDIPGIAFLDLNYGSNKLLTFNHSKKIGILTDNPQSELDVAGTIRAKEVKIEATGWSDFVFDNNYDLPKLSEVEKHINEKQHLPGIPSEKEVLENGVNVVDMQAKLLQKIEELTLYVINLKKENEIQNKRIESLEEENNLLKNK